MHTRSVKSFALSANTALAASSAANSSNPCAALSASYAAQQNSSSTIFTPSQVATCLNDVPIDKNAATAQVNWINNYLQLQSTLAYLKNPPADYPLPPTDLLGSLATIGQKVLAEQYSGEFEFETDITNLFLSANDGHLAFSGALSGEFQFTTNVNLVSVSLDGVQLPKVYFLTDIQAKYGSKDNVSISAISQINSIDVVEYLQSLGSQQGFQDPDAQYNSVFYCLSPQTGHGTTLDPSPGAYNSQPFNIQQNDTTRYDFENGTSSTQSNQVSPNEPITFSSGEQILQVLLHPPPPPTNDGSSGGSSGGSSSNSSAPSLPIPLGYPVPFVSDSIGAVSGYFLETPGVNDVAVLSIPSFEPDDEDSFRATVQNFLDKSRSSNKKRLIIDVRQNGGGTATLAYDTFKRLFPSVAPYSGVRLRNSPESFAIGTQTSKNSNTSAATPLNLALSGLKQGAFDSQSYLHKEGGQVYTSWQDYSQADLEHGDNYTQIAALDLPYFGDVISGRGLHQTFAGENIILFTDADCSSTCTVFSNLLINQGNVTTVTAGGRPNNGPMVAIGGVQGSNELDFSTIQGFAQSAIQVASLTAGNNSAEGRETLKLLSPLAANPPIVLGSSGASLNARDNIADGDTTETPLQFTRLYSDCRIFNTPGDVLNVTNTWTRIVNGIAAGGKGLCINGTIGRFADASGNATATGYNGTTISSGSGSSSGSSSGSGSSGSSGSNSTATGGSGFGPSPSPTFSGAPGASQSPIRPIPANPNSAPAGLLQQGGMLLVAVQCFSIVYYVLAF
ncbi:MAG: hypothetical protein M1821_009670 [Bathelium mastoideum]|nr:MAG: hypothetical protein M1821_009670 [Bathelium mastoideum]